MPAFYQFSANDFGYIPSAPQPAQGLIVHLAGELISAYQALRIYRTLYAKENMALLESAAPAFFVYLKWAMQRDVILTLCRIADRAETMGKKNATLARLCELLPDNSELADATTQFRDEVKRLIRPHRDKLISHSDELANIGTAENFVPNVKREAIEDALELAAMAFYAARRQFADSPASLLDIEHNGEAESLLAALNQAKEYLDLRREWASRNP